MNINEFYKTLKAFLKQLIVVFPEDDTLKVLSTSLSLAMKENNNKIVENFHNAFVPFEDLLVARNDTFFEKVTCKEKRQAELFEKLKWYYFIMSDTNKTVVWDYIQTLYSLS
jgi:hypothetical protein